MYIDRSIQTTITKAAEGFKAILVTGPRQVGKSTVLKHIYPNLPYVTFDDPILLAETKKEPGLFFRNHVPPVVIDEVQYIAELFPYIITQFLTAMAARTGQMLNYATVAEQIEIAASTVREWVSLLETFGIIYIMQPYTNSALNRAIKTPKVYFRDTGLACFLTKYQTPETARNGAMAGALFETFVVSEVLKSFSNAGCDYRMNVSYYIQGKG